jgi:hypothetical protein
MSTLTIDGLEALLQCIGVKTPIPQYEKSAILTKPLDVGRVYLASTVQNLRPDCAKSALGAIQATANIDHGDLCIIVPKLDHECDAELYGLELMQKVRLMFIEPNLALSKLTLG